MKKNKISILPLLFIVPILLGNSPVPVVKADDYSSFESQFISKEQDDDYYVYSYKISNSGEGYIKSAYLSFSTDNGNYGMTTYYNDPLFGVLLLAPNKDGIYRFETYADIDVNNASIKSVAYTRFVENAVVGDKREIGQENGNYVIYFDSDYPVDSQYMYGAIVDFTYDGASYSKFYQGVAVNTIYFTSINKDAIDISKLTIDKITIAYSDRDVNNAYKVLEIAIKVFIYAAIVFVASGVLFAIIFPTVRAIKRKKAKENSENN